MRENERNVTEMSEMERSERDNERYEEVGREKKEMRDGR